MANNHNATKEQERAELHRAIWQIANDLRGSVDGWDFKQYVLGILFYRFISENLTNYINADERRAGKKDFDYAMLSNKEAEFGRADTVKEKGFYILPNQLFVNVRKNARNDANFNETLTKVFRNIENSAKGASSESEVRESDIYIGIIGQQYGAIGKNKISSTEEEFKEAKRSHKNILIYIKGENGENDKKRDKSVQRLIEEIGHAQEGFTRKRFNNTVELTRLVYASLIDFLKEEGIVGRGAFDEWICKDAKFTDIDEEKIRWFLKMAKAIRKYSLKLDAPIETVLTHLDLIKEGRLTNAAVLLFGKNPNRFFKQAEVKCLQFSGTKVKKPFINYQVYSGNLFEQVDKAVAFVLDAIKFPVIQKAGSARFHRPYEIPEFAIQEAIVNAVTHRNYNNTSGVQVMVFADRIEVWNSGTLPPGLTVEDLKKPHTSFPANPFLANALYLADYAQKAGSGTIEMIEQCKAQQVPEPEFVLIRNVEFRTILPKDIYTESFFQRAGLNQRQVQAIKLVREKGSISLIDLKIIYTNVTDRTLNRDLQALVENRILKVQGEKKGRRYGF